LYAIVLYLLSFQKPPPDVYQKREMSAVSTPIVIETEGRINLNSATFEELDTLPGIGEVTALAILEMREKLGGFRYLEDLLLVHGIGEKKLAAIYDLIYVK